MNAITSRLAPLSVAAAGVLAVAGAAQADSRHHHAYSHLPHTHTYSHAHGSHHSGGQAIGNAIIVGGLLLGGIALLDALSDSNTNTNANVSISTHIGSSNGPVLTWTPPAYKPPVVAPPTHAPAPQYTTKCRDHGHISVVKDGPRQFSLRRPDGGGCSRRSKAGARCNGRSRVHWILSASIPPASSKPNAMAGLKNPVLPRRWSVAARSAPLVGRR